MAEHMDLPTTAKLASNAEEVLDITSLPALDMLKAHIMAEIEDKLSKKEDSLWKRGQAEIRRLTSTVTTLQEENQKLQEENQKTRTAVNHVTANFEIAVKQVHAAIAVLQALPARQRAVVERSPSAASTSASENAREEDPALRGDPRRQWSSEQARRPLQTPTGHQTSTASLQMWHSRGPNPGEECAPGLLLNGRASVESEDIVLGSDNSTFCTPPRAGSSVEEMTTLDVSAPPPPASWQGISSTASPAVLLSLANALPSAPATANSGTPNPSPGLKLHLAEHLEQQLEAPITTPTQTPLSLDSAIAGVAANSLSSQLERFKIELVKDQRVNTLGLQVNQAVEQAWLCVEEIDPDGLIDRYNNQQTSEVHKVRIGDRIVEVNGVVNDSAEMLQQCKSQKKLTMTVSRTKTRSHSASATDVLDAITAKVSKPSGEAAVIKCASGVEDDVVPSENKVASPSARQLRPDAQVFVPSAQKDSSSAASLSVPPGLGYDMGGLVKLANGLPGGASAVGQNVATSLLATAPPSQTQAPFPQGSDPLQVLGLQPVCEQSAFEEVAIEPQDVKRALFSS